MKKIIFLLFITTIITFSCRNNKKSEDLDLVQLNGVAENINKNLQQISKDLKEVTLYATYNIPYNNPVAWDDAGYTKKNQYPFTPGQKNSSAIYLPENKTLNAHLKKIIVHSKRMDSLFIKFVNDNSFVQQVYFLDTTSFLRIYPFTDVSRCFSKSIELTNRLPYQKVYHNPFIEEESYWVETPYADLYGHGWIISCVEPVYYREQFIGILSADIPIKNFLQKYFQSPSEILILTDKKGNVICTTPQGSKRFNIPIYREFIYYKPVTRDILMYNSPSLAKHENKRLRNAINKILEGSCKENFYINSEKYTIYQAKIKETNWLLLKIIY